MIDNVVILATGLGTRLKDKTRYLPKILVNIDQHTALYHQLKYWNSLLDHLSSVYIIVSNLHEKKIKAYLEYMIKDENPWPNLNVIVKTDNTKPDGSNNALVRFFANNPQVKSAFLNWSDIIPVSKIVNKITPPITNIIYTNGNTHRYLASNNRIIESDEGNVVGLYYLTDIQNNPNLSFSPDNIDLIESRVFIHFDLIEIDEVIDFGDLEKFNSVKQNVISRSFNSVDILTNLVMKSPLNKQGSELNKKEVNFYRNAKTIDVKLFPEIHNYSSNGAIVMDKIKWKSLSKHRKNKEEKLYKAAEILDNEMHEPTERLVAEKTIFNDLHVEIFQKTVDRHNTIKSLLEGFPTIENVNGIPIFKYDDVARAILSYMIQQYKSMNKTYSFIHGDTNLSNVFYKNEKVKLIDPRGYFGKTSYIGLPSYDRAKLLYGASGYDNFNENLDFSLGEFCPMNKDISIFIEPWLEGFQDLNNKYFTNIEQAWLPIIWMNLGGYFKNNPLKAFTAFNYGLSLATQFFQKHSDSFHLNLDKKQVYFKALYAKSYQISTTKPDKWVLLDIETNEIYRPNFCYSSNSDNHWNKQ